MHTHDTHTHAHTHRYAVVPASAAPVASSSTGNAPLQPVDACVELYLAAKAEAVSGWSCANACNSTGGEADHACMCCWGRLQGTAVAHTLTPPAGDVARSAQVPRPHASCSTMRRTKHQAPSAPPPPLPWLQEMRLTDGAGAKPAYSLRTLCRALDYARTTAPHYGLQRALYDGFSMAFATQVRAAERLELVCRMWEWRMPCGVKRLLHHARCCFCCAICGQGRG